jgi:hypothetical protein
VWPGRIKGRTQINTAMAACWICSEMFFFVARSAEMPRSANELPNRRMLGMSFMGDSFAIFVNY